LPAKILIISKVLLEKFALKSDEINEGMFEAV
jgi:hypothetical protein